MFDKITSVIGGGLLKGANNLVKTIWGSEEQRDSAAHAEQMTVMEQFAAEFLPRENRSWWDSFVDGLNRLPRPVMTFGIVGLFGYCVVDPLGFSASMEALTLMPDYGWALMATVVTFWFGGKFLGGMKGSTSAAVDPDTLQKVLDFYDRRELQKKAITKEGTNE